MEAAIVAMTAPLRAPDVPKLQAPRKRQFDEPVGKRKKKKGESKKEDKCNSAARSLSSAQGALIFSRTLGGANFIVAEDSEGQGVVVEGIERVEEALTERSSRLRLCFRAIMTLKIVAMSQAGLPKLNLSALTNALRGSSWLQHLMDLRDRLKTALKCPHKSTATLAVHALLDALYMELLPLAVSSKAVRGLLPDPGAYLACALQAQRSGEDELFATLAKDSNRIYAYLQLRRMEAEHLHLAEVFSDVVQHEGLSVTKDDHTMRGTCPVGTPTIRQWQDSGRDRMCHWSAFACPDKESLSLIDRFCKAAQAKCVVELGAGTGYWARLLRKQSKNIRLLATDILPPRGQGMEHSKRMNEYHGCFAPWTHVESLAAEKASAMSCDVLMLVYPPPSTPMALNALRSTKALHLVYVGEFRGDTADSAFERELFSKYACVKVRALPCWTNTADRISFWIRKKESVDAVTAFETQDDTFSLTTPLCCAGCGKDLVPSVVEGKGIYRDRLTRCIFACDDMCTQMDSSRKAVEKEATLRHLHEVHKGDLPFDKRWTLVS